MPSGIHNITVEDDASLSQQGSPYWGPYTTFPPPEYGPYYPGTPSGQHLRLWWYVAWVDVFQIHPCTPCHRSPQLLCWQVCILWYVCLHVISTWTNVIIAAQHDL